MTTMLALVSSCRLPQTDNGGPPVPRGLEARVVESTVYGRCRELGSTRGELRPVDCEPRLSPAETRELLSLSEPGREATAGDRALAAAVAVALSGDAGTLERSIAAITSIAGADSAKGSRWTALGALQHARARATGDPGLLVDALESTHRALRALPESHAGRFNRAVIEGDLGLCRQARASWRAYLALDRSSEWADEGRTRLRALPCGDRADSTARRDTGRIAPMERDHFLEETLEEHLPRWLEGSRGGLREDERELQRISNRAARLEASAGDPWLRELTEEFRNHAPDSGYLRAIGSYVRGRRFFREEDYRTARRALSAARPALSGRNSALLPWCDLWLAGIDVYEGRFRQAEARLGRLVNEPKVARSPMLAGKVGWARGLTAMRAGRLQDAYDRYSAAGRAFERGGYLTSSASIHMLKAEVLADLGLVAESWRERVATLRALQGPDPHFMFRNALLDGAAVAGAHGAPRVAGAMLDEVQTVAEESEDVASAAEVLLFRGEVMLGAGEAHEAAEAFRQVLVTTRGLSRGLVRERLETHAGLGLWATATAQSTGDLSELDPIIRFYGDKGPRSLQLLALRVKARLAQESGREQMSREAVAEAIRQIRRAQSDLRDESFELRHWETAQSVFDEAVLLAFSAAAPVEALSLLEEARDLGVSRTRELPVETCEPVEPGGTYPFHGTTESVVLEFGVVGDEHVWWRIDGDRCVYGRGDARRSRATAERLATLSGTGLATEDLDRLYEDLLAAPLRGVPPGVRLRLVPDRHLLRVPFAALRNPRTGLRLVEERAISFHRDLDSALDAGLEPREAPPRRTWTVLAVGDPTFDRSSLPWLQPLPGARAEAETVASLYAGGSELLLGPAATLGRLRESSPGRQVLHLAVHTLTSPGGMSDGLVLASEGTAGGSSGLSSVRDLVPAIPQGLELVVLSGCSTLGTTPTRSSGLAGLARPFVSQGVPAVVGTLWPVGDDLLTDLMTRFHAGVLSGASASDALRQAQLELLESSPDVGCCDWAAIQLFGDLPASDSDTTERSGS